MNSDREEWRSCQRHGSDLRSGYANALNSEGTNSGLAVRKASLCWWIIRSPANTGGLRKIWDCKAYLSPNDKENHVTKRWIVDASYVVAVNTNCQYSRMKNRCQPTKPFPETGVLWKNQYKWMGLPGLPLGQEDRHPETPSRFGRAIGLSLSRTSYCDPKVTSLKHSTLKHLLSLQDRIFHAYVIKR